MDFLFTGLWTVEPALSVAAFVALRVSIGLFFAISGYHKLFNPERHKSLVSTFKEDGIPFVKVNQWFVPSVEFFGGLGLIVGFLTPLAALGLLCICIVACAVDGLKRLHGVQTLDVADYVDDILYLPEVIYALALAYIVAHGSGYWSVDEVILHVFY